MGKGKSFNLSQGNGGIMGSGIFGMFGTTIHCDAKDDSYFCELSKLVNGLIMIILLGAIIYIAYLFITMMFRVGGGRKMRGGASSIFR